MYLSSTLKLCIATSSLQRDCTFVMSFPRSGSAFLWICICMCMYIYIYICIHFANLGVEKKKNTKGNTVVAY